MKKIFYSIKDRLFPKNKRYPAFKTRCGFWIVEICQATGVLLRHVDGHREYHFGANSNGWITAVGNPKDKKNCLITVLEVNGILKNANPVFVDEESNKNLIRFLELKERAKNSGLTMEEQEELLSLVTA